MSIRIDNQVTNQLSVPIMLANNFANRPAAGIFGRLFISSDTYQIFQDRVSGWSLIADAGSGSSNLQQVTANGNTTTYGISIVGSGYLSVLSLLNGGVLFPDGGSGQLSQDTTTFFWDNTNKRLGLGTASPGQRLDVHSSTNITAQFNGTGVTNATLQFQNAGTSKWTIGNYYNSGNNDFNIYDNVNTTYRAYFTNTGYAIFPNNVIIGSTNRSSSYGLDVYSSAYFRSSIYNINYTQGSILFAGASGLVNQNNSQFFWDNTNNRLGLGTTTLYNKLDINQAGSGANAVSGVGLKIYADAGNDASIGISQSARGSATIGMQSAVSAPANFVIGTDVSGVISFKQGMTIGDLSSGTEKMRITSGGNLLIATSTDAGYKLDVNGTGRFIGDTETLRIYTTNSTGYTSLKIMNDLASTSRMFEIKYYGSASGTGESAVLGTIGGAPISFITTNVNRLNIAAGGVITISNLAGTGSRAVLADSSGVLSAPVSDISVKQNIIPIEYGLKEIVKMNPVWFDFIDEYKNYGKGRQNGNIAQEIESIIPEAVFTTPTTGKMGINYDQLHAVYIKAIQELNEKLVRNNIN